MRGAAPGFWSTASIFMGGIITVAIVFQVVNGKNSTTLGNTFGTTLTGVTKTLFTP